MRALLLSVCLLGCSSSTTVIHEDAAPTSDAGLASQPDVTAPPDNACKSAALSCAATARTCDGGFVFDCYDTAASACPTGDVGACTVLSTDPLSGHTEACCEQQACVRAAKPDDQQCADKSAAKPVAWTCAPNVVPPDCVRLNPGAIPDGTASVDYCCAK